MMPISHRGESDAPTDVHRRQVLSTSSELLKAAHRCGVRLCIDFVDDDKGEAVQD